MEDCDYDNGLIDFSSENDNLIISDSSSTLVSALANPNSSETLEDAKGSELLEVVNSENEINHAHANGQTEESPQLQETSEPDQKPKNGKYNMRKSFAWDSAFFTSSETLDDTKSFELLEVVNSENEINHAQANAQIEELPQLHETSEPERRPKSGKCNMRKSLAWDSAFFTSSGVLDAEELTSMIEGPEKSKKHVLSRIEEDICRSTDSISSLVSENLALESLEAELFQDIRASIQRSSKASNLENSCSKATSQESDTPVLSSSKRVDPGSRSRLKPKSTSKAPSGLQRSEKALQQPSPGPQTIQTNSRIRDLASALTRPPIPISGPHDPKRLSTSLTKRASLSANHAKVETEGTKITNGGSKGVQPSKLPSLTGPRRAVPKPAPPLKPSSSIGSSATTKTNMSRTTSTGNSTSASSNNILKFTARRKTDPVPQTSARIKKQPAKSNLSGHSKLTSLSSNISPASSISEWSSESSSSASTADRKSISRASIESSSSCRSIESEAHALGLNAEPNVPSQNVKKGPIPAGAVSRPPSMKPSGLRMPSPKIGFFDGAKSTSRTPNGGLSKVGRSNNSPIGVSLNKSKLGSAQKSVSPPGTTNKVSTSSKGVKGQSKAEENGIEVVKDQEYVDSISSCIEVSCIDTGAKQQSESVESQKDDLIAKRTPFTENNSISRESSVDVVDKIAAFRPDEIGLKENS